MGLSSDRRPVLGIIDYLRCFIAVSPLKLEILVVVKLYDIHVICSLNIQKQGIDNQESQGTQSVIYQV